MYSPRKPFENWNTVNKFQAKRGNFNRILGSMRKARNIEAAPVVKTIQKYFRGYKSRVIEPRKKFLMDLSADKRFDYYVEVLSKLEYNVESVLRSISMGGADPLNAITRIVGVCHYNRRPLKKLENVKNIRKELPLLKRKTPKEYLDSLRRQFGYVAKEYAQMSSEDKKGYRDRLDSELSGRPCLENILESLVKVLSKPDFVWIGKTKYYQNNPLSNNNIRYVGFGANLVNKKGVTRRGIMNTAVTTWSHSKNRPSKWTNMNVDARKNVFWKMVKNLPLSMYSRNMVVNGTPNGYNKDGTKFKASMLANTLEYA